MFKILHQLQEAYQKEKGWKTLKSHKFRKEVFTCNNDTSQNRRDLSFPQNYQHLLPIENMQNN
jgi:hypothetical protein